MIRIGLVDDHPVVRAGLSEWFQSHVDLTVVAQAQSGRGAIDLVRDCEIDVLVLDLAMPHQSGFDVLGILHANVPTLGVLVLSGYPESLYALNMIRQGASGYLNKTCDPAEIVVAVRTIAAGRRYISTAVADLLVDLLTHSGTTVPHEELSRREFQVFLRLAQGDSTCTIRDELSLTSRTITSRRASVMAKLGLSTNSELTYYALQKRLLD